MAGAERKSHLVPLLAMLYVLLEKWFLDEDSSNLKLHREIAVSSSSENSLQLTRVAKQHANAEPVHALLVAQLHATRYSVPFVPPSAMTSANARS